MAASTKEIAIITGGNTGLGLECARKLLRENSDRFHVVIGCRTLSKGEDAVATLKADGHQGIECVQLDVTSEDSVAEAANTITERHGKVDVLLVNVSCRHNSHIVTLDCADTYAGTGRHCARH